MTDKEKERVKNGYIVFGMLVLFIVGFFSRRIDILFTLLMSGWILWLFAKDGVEKITGSLKGVRPIGPGSSLPPNERVKSAPVPNPVTATSVAPLVEMPGELAHVEKATTNNPKLSKDWFSTLVRDAVHILIIGETNSGKSTAAKAILKQRASNGEKVIILDPHARPSTWNGLEAVGRGRDYQAIESMITVLQTELQQRYQEYSADDNYNPTRLNIFVDEVPSIASYCDSWQDFFTVISCEARKVNMSLICLSQSRLVDMLGIKGRSDVRENFSELLLGDKAVKVIKDLAGTNRPAVLDHGGKVLAVDTSALPGLGTGDINAGVLWIPNHKTVAQNGVQGASGAFQDTPAITTAPLTEEEVIKLNDWIAEYEEAGVTRYRLLITKQLYRLRGGSKTDYDGRGPLYQIVQRYLDNLE